MSDVDDALIRRADAQDFEDDAADRGGAGCGGGTGVKGLSLAPVSFADASRFVNDRHRHHSAPRGHKFSLAAVRDGRVVGVAIVGRPVSRVRDDGATLEVTRLCTDGTRNAPSFLLGAAARATFALGYLRIGTYTLVTESGASLRAAGWRLVGEVRGRSWNCVSRPRIDGPALGDKLLWEVAA